MAWLLLAAVGDIRWQWRTRDRMQMQKVNKEKVNENEEATGTGERSAARSGERGEERQQ